MSALVYTTPVDESTMQTLVMSLTHIAVGYLLWVFNTLPPLSSLDITHAIISKIALKFM